jgi:hypothetical protein
MVVHVGQERRVGCADDVDGDGRSTHGGG